QICPGPQPPQSPPQPSGPHRPSPQSGVQGPVSSAPSRDSPPVAGAVVCAWAGSIRVSTTGRAHAWGREVCDVTTPPAPSAASSLRRVRVGDVLVPSASTGDADLFRSFIANRQLFENYRFVCWSIGTM